MENEEKNKDAKIVNNATNIVKVLIQIYDLSSKQETVTFAKLVKILNGRITRNTISTALDSLNDLGLIKWENKIVSKIVVIEIELTEIGEDFAKKIYDKVIKE